MAVVRIYYYCKTFPKDPTSNFSDLIFKIFVQLADPHPLCLINIHTFILSLSSHLLALI